MTGQDDRDIPARPCAHAYHDHLTKYHTLLAVCLAGFMSACSSSERSPKVSRAVSPTLGVSASPYHPAARPHPGQRHATSSRSLPKGGGSRKVGNPYKIAGRWYTPKEDPTYDRVGIASWYGSDFHGRKTANGEIYDMNALTAAHKTLPLPSYAYVTNQRNNRTVLVRINDRGPYAGNRIIDLSRATARALGTEQSGLAKVRVQYAGPAPLDGNDYHERKFLASQNWSRPMSIARRDVRQSHAPQRQLSQTTLWDAQRYRRGLGRHGLGRQ